MIVTHKHMARLYISEARRTKHRAWAFTLLTWAAKCRLAAMAEVRKGQLDLFGANP